MGVSGQVTKDNLFTQVVDNFKNLLEENVVDPKQRHKATIVHSGRLYPSGVDFVGYPYMIVRPPTTEETWMSNSGTVGRFKIPAVIEILATDFPSLDNVSTQVFRILNADSTEDLFRNDYGIGMFHITSGRFDEEFIEGLKVQVRTIEVTAEMYLEVS